MKKFLYVGLLTGAALLAVPNFSARAQIDVSSYQALSESIKAIETQIAALQALAETSDDETLKTSLANLQTLYNSLTAQAAAIDANINKALSFDAKEGDNLTQKLSKLSQEIEGQKEEVINALDSAIDAAYDTIKELEKEITYFEKEIEKIEECNPDCEPDDDACENPCSEDSDANKQAMQDLIDKAKELADNVQNLYGADNDEGDTGSNNVTGSTPNYGGDTGYYQVPTIPDTGYSEQISEGISDLLPSKSTLTDSNGQVDEKVYAEVKANRRELVLAVAQEAYLASEKHIDYAENTSDKRIEEILTKADKAKDKIEALSYNTLMVINAIREAMFATLIESEKLKLEAAKALYDLKEVTLEGDLKSSETENTAKSATKSDDSSDLTPSGN